MKLFVLNSLVSIIHPFIFVAPKENVLHFGSKAKLSDTEADVLDIAEPDLCCYLSEVDGPHETRTEKVKINSAIVKPNHSQVKQGPDERKRKHSSHNFSNRWIDNKLARGRQIGSNNTNHRYASDPRPRSVNNTTSQIIKHTETRGTQTDRVGPCKCARQLQQRNKRKRSENQINKQIVDTLERIDVIKYTN